MTATSARSEALLVSAAVLAGALAGVIVQAAIEVGRGRRADRDQLRAAGQVIDGYADALEHADELADQLQHECDGLRAKLRTADAAIDQQASRADALRAELTLRDAIAPCLCGADGPEGDGGTHEPNCPRWQAPPAPEVAA